MSPHSPPPALPAAEGRGRMAAICKDLAPKMSYIDRGRKFWNMSEEDKQRRIDEQADPCRSPGREDGSDTR